VPVIVDASAALPPRSNLRDFVAAGAALVAFSGGKALRGPQASGILVGRRDLIRSVALQHQDMDVYPATWTFRRELIDSGLLPGPPLQGIGRALKVGKEEIAGLLAALRLYLERDEAADEAEWRRQARIVAEAVAGLPDVQAEVTGPGVRPIPVAQVSWDEARLGITGPQLIVALAEGAPPICVGGDGAGGRVNFNPFSLKPGEAELIGERVRVLLGGG
jgi:L-seryl-tRNA(Ser) seleniumtransferase